jgi:hypothetical protein
MVWDGPHPGHLPEGEGTDRGVCLKVGDVLGLGECGGVKVKRSQPSAAPTVGLRWVLVGYPELCRSRSVLPGR